MMTSVDIAITLIIPLVIGDTCTTRAIHNVGCRRKCHHNSEYQGHGDH